MRLPANSVNLIRGGNVIKRGDETPITFQFNDEAGDLVELTGATVTVRLANSKILILEKPARVNEDHTVTFSIDDEDTTGFGEMRLEFVVEYESGVTEIFPAQGYQEIIITPSLGGLDTGHIEVVTLRDFERRIDQAVGETREAIQEVDQTIERANEANDLANQSISDANEAVESANTAVQQANDAGEYATTQGDYAKEQGDRARAESENLEGLIMNVSDATDRANESADRADISTGNAEEATTEALTQAENARNQADYAKTQGDYALSSADEAVEAGEFATNQGNFAREQGEFARNEASDLSGLKSDVETATDNANQSALDASNSATNASESASEAQQQATYAKTQGDYALEYAEDARISAVDARTAGQYATDQGDYAKEQGDRAQAEASNLEGLKADVTTATTQANEATTNANESATSADQSATNAQEQAEFAELQGAYAKEQGDYARAQGQIIEDIFEDGSVQSVNGQTGIVNLDADDIGAETPEGAQAKADTAEQNAIDHADSAIAEIPEPTWENVTGKPETFTPSDHNHSISEVNGLQERLDGKVDQVEGQGLSSNDFTDEEKTKLSGIEAGAEVNQVTSVNGEVGDVTVQGFSGDYGDLSGVPESFPPENHTHQFSELEGLPETFTPSDHDHSISEVNGLQESLDGKVDQVEGQGLSSNDFTDEEKTKLSGIEDGAERNAVTSVNDQTGDVTIETFSGDYNDLDNTPTIPTSAEDLGAIPTTEKGVPGGVAGINEEGKVVDAEGNEVEGKVTSVNGQVGDVTIETFSGDYNDLDNAPAIPTATSQLTNDSDFATNNSLNAVTGALLAHGEDIASTTMLGHVKVDGETITASSDGTISAQGGGEQAWEKITDLNLGESLSKIEFENLGLEQYRFIHIMGSMVSSDGIVRDMTMVFNDDISLGRYKVRYIKASGSSVNSSSSNLDQIELPDLMADDQYGNNIFSFYIANTEGASKPCNFQYTVLDDRRSPSITIVYMGSAVYHDSSLINKITLDGYLGQNTRLSLMGVK